MLLSKLARLGQKMQVSIQGAMYREFHSAWEFSRRHGASDQRGEVGADATPTPKTEARRVP